MNEDIVNAIISGIGSEDTAAEQALAIVERLAAAGYEIATRSSLPEWRPIEPIKKPHRTMTPQEYADMKIVGWHQVCKNVDLAGNIGVRYGAHLEQGLDKP